MIPEELYSKEAQEVRKIYKAVEEYTRKAEAVCRPREGEQPQFADRLHRHLAVIKAEPGHYHEIQCLDCGACLTSIAGKMTLDDLVFYTKKEFPGAEVMWAEDCDKTRPQPKWRTSTSVEIGWELVDEKGEILGRVMSKPECNWEPDETVRGGYNLKPEPGWEAYLRRTFRTQEEAHDWVENYNKNCQLEE